MADNSHKKDSILNEEPTAGLVRDGPAPPITSRNKRHRGGRKRRHRRQSFALTHDSRANSINDVDRPSLMNVAGQSGTHSSMYRLENKSNTSVDSDILLDHRYKRCSLLVIVLTWLVESRLR